MKVFFLLCSIEKNREAPYLLQYSTTINLYIFQYLLSTDHRYRLRPVFPLGRGCASAFLRDWDQSQHRNPKRSQQKQSIAPTRRLNLETVPFHLTSFPKQPKAFSLPKRPSAASLKYQ